MPQGRGGGEARLEGVEGLLLSSAHNHWFFELKRSLTFGGFENSAILDWNLVSWLVVLKLPKESFLTFTMASTFLRSTQTPSESMTVPRNSTDSLQNSHFSSFSARLTSCSL